MNLFNKYILTFSLFFVSVCSFAQYEETKSGEKDEYQYIVNKTIAQVSDGREEDFNEDDIEILYNVLYDAISRPINLNLKDINELREYLTSMLILSDAQINALINHREKNGKLMVVYELQTIEGWDANTIERIAPYTVVADNSEKTNISIKEAFANGKHKFTFRVEHVFEDRDGYDDYLVDGVVNNERGDSLNKRYLGSPVRIYTQYNFSFGNKLSFGFTADKDQGEEFFKGSQAVDISKYQMGYDFFSSHLFMRGLGQIGTSGIKIDKVALGDYQAQFGQGLTFYMGRAAFKSSNAMAVKQNATGLRKYSAATESGFLRGAGVALSYKKIETTIFGSYNLNTQSVDTNEVELENGFILEDQAGSISTSGFHRTSREASQKDAVAEKIFGGNLAYKGGKLNLGITAVQHEYSTPFGPKSDNYSKFQFGGSDNLTNIGVDYNYLYKNFNFFGEFSRSSQTNTNAEDGYAHINGVLANLDPKFSVAAIYRDYGVKYQHQVDHAEAFGDQGRKQNEEGLYVGAVAQLHKKVTLNAYFDNIYFPWKTFQANSPLARQDVNAQINYVVKRKWETYFRFRSRNREVKGSDGANTNTVLDQYRFNFKYGTGVKGLTASSRVELMNYTKEAKNENGYVIFQDFSFKNPNWHFPLSLHAHYAIFNASFNSKVYVYERGVPYGWSWAYQGVGTRINLVAKYQFFRGFNGYIRYARFFYTDRDQISSSLEQIDTNHKSQIYAQIIYKF